MMRTFPISASSLAVGLCLLLLSGAALAEGYAVGPGDVLSVAVRGGSEGDNSDQLLTVAGDGTIDVGYAGRFNVNGLTTPAIQSAISERLKEKQIFALPRVSVNISEYGSQPINVAGAVGNPMRVFLKGPARLRDVLAEAGGVNTETAGQEIRIQRRGVLAPIVVDRAELYGINPEAIERSNLNLQAFDDVFVTGKGRACVAGQVNEPGCFDLDEGATLLTLLAEAGGLNEETANRDRVTIWRSYPEESRLTIDINEIAAGAARPPRIHPGDNILVELRLNVTVGGSVKDAGIIPYYEGMTITDAIAGAGGVEGTDVYANLKNVSLRRGTEVRVINVRAIQDGKQPDVPLEPGDKINVKAKRLGW